MRTQKRQRMPYLCSVCATCCCCCVCVSPHEAHCPPCILLLLCTPLPAQGDLQAESGNQQCRDSATMPLLPGETTHRCWDSAAARLLTAAPPAIAAVAAGELFAGLLPG
jgi:hypothetical protein